MYFSIQGRDIRWLAPDSPDPCGYSSSSPGTPSLHRCPGTHSRAMPSGACLSSPAGSWAGSHFPWALSLCRGASAVYTPHRAEPASSVTVSYRGKTHQWTELFLRCKTVISHFYSWDKISINPTTRNAQNFLSTHCTEKRRPKSLCGASKVIFVEYCTPHIQLAAAPFSSSCCIVFCILIIDFSQPRFSRNPSRPNDNL